LLAAGRLLLQRRNCADLHLFRGHADCTARSRQDYDHFLSRHRNARESLMAVAKIAENEEMGTA
jgi:hypothetical protein